MNILTDLSVFILALLLCFSIHTQAQDNSLVLSPEKPEPGQKLSLTYTGRLAHENTKMYVFYGLEDNRLGSTTVPIKYSEGKLSGDITVPQNALSIFVQVLHVEDIDTNEGKGFRSLIYKDGIPVKGALYALASSFRFDPSRLRIETNPVAAVELMEREFSINPDLKKGLYPLFYAQTLNLIPSRVADAQELARSEVERIKMTGEGSGATWMYAQLLYPTSRKSQDSLIKEVLTLYPKGELAFITPLNSMNGYNDIKPDTSLQLYKSIKDNIDLTPARKRMLELGVLDVYAFQQDFIRFDSTINLLKAEFPDINLGLSYLNMAKRTVDVGGNQEKAEYYVKLALDNLAMLDSLSTNFGRAKYLNSETLKKKGFLAEASKESRDALHLTNFSNKQISQAFLEVLLTNADYDEAKKTGEFLILNRVSNATIDSLHKVAFAHLYDAEQYEKEKSRLKSISDDVYTLVISRKLKNDLAPNFEVNDLNGNKVNLADFKGKVVVLDFWATWCGPCIKAFPAMQKLMRELKEQGVEFLFVNTSEQENNEPTRIDKIKRQMTRSKTEDFTVLVDKVNAQSNMYELSSLYQSTILPSKVIIDRKGNIRYKSTGFSTEERLFREIKTVLSLIE